LVPGRAGSGVYLREVLALGGEGEAFVLGASDGMTTAPLPLAACGDAIVVHSVSGAPLPPDQGGPFRVLVPPGASSCGAVKGLARVRVLGPT
jgi:DMSO/TMAO reductase YedYZ molybdopterin-dependent catalytic subunit